MTIAAALLAACASTLAKPAYPGLRTATQPDGSTLQIRVTGDEHGHSIYTADGIMLAGNASDGYYYATLAPDGHIVASTLLARSAGDRSADDIRFISLSDQPALRKASARIRAERIARRSPSTRSTRRTVRTGPFIAGTDMLTTTFPGKGEQRALVILVEFADTKFTRHDPKTFYHDMLNKKGFTEVGCIGSARDYFIEASDGAFMPTFDVYGPVTVAHEASYYGKNNRYDEDTAAEEVIIEACSLLDGEIDFRDYDRDGDGFIDNVYVFHAGYGEADSRIEDTIWPHSYDLTSAYPNRRIMHDGVQLDHYAISNEVNSDTETTDGIGTFVHEFSHVLGLPDLYSTDYSDAFTPGEWSVLDYGPYNGNGSVPPTYSIFERYSMGWMQPDMILNSGDMELADISSNKGYIVPTERINEFFLFENRQQNGWDNYIPNSGMLVWHIDYNESAWLFNVVNNSGRHQYVDLVEADGTATESSVRGDCFPGISNVTSFTPDTNPAFKSWTGKDTGTSLSSISLDNGMIRFHAEVADNPSTSISAPDEDPETPPAADGLTVTLGAASVVYDLTGTTIRGGIAGESILLPAPGIYIIRTAARSYKLVVR